MASGPQRHAQRRRSFSLGTAAVSAGAPESELTRHLKEMNILSAHRSSNPTTPATQSVSPMCRNGVAGSSGWAMVCRRIAGYAVDEPQASREYCDAGIIALDRTSAATTARHAREHGPA